MRIISFAYTTPAFQARAKNVTRRMWQAQYAKRWKVGEEAIGYSRQPLYGGEPIGTIRVEFLAREPIATMPDSDYEAEGFRWLHEHGIPAPKSSGFEDFSWASFERWRQSGVTPWVVRFEILEVVGER